MIFVKNLIFYVCLFFIGSTLLGSDMKVDQEIEVEGLFTYTQKIRDHSRVEHIWDPKVSGFCALYHKTDSFEWSIPAYYFFQSSVGMAVGERSVTICFSFSKIDKRYFAYRFTPSSKQAAKFEVNFIQGSWYTHKNYLNLEWFDGGYHDNNAEFLITETFRHELKECLERNIIRGYDGSVEGFTDIRCHYMEISTSLPRLVITGGKLILDGEWPVKSMCMKARSKMSQMRQHLCKLQKELMNPTLQDDE